MRSAACFGKFVCVGPERQTLYIVKPTARKEHPAFLRARHASQGASWQVRCRLDDVPSIRL